MKDIKKIIKTTTFKNQDKVNWTKVWSSKYPVLKTYQSKVDIKKYSNKIRILLEELKNVYGYNELDAILVLKDILAHELKK